jgi:predicted Zn-dependent protease
MQSPAAGTKMISRMGDAMKAAKWAGWVVVPLLMATGCQTVETTESGVVGVEREQRFTTLLSEKEVEAQASKEYAQMMAAAQQQGVLNRNAQQVRRVRTVAQRLIPHVDAFRSDALQWSWEVNVLSAKQVNAWCMPGGKMAVYTGLLERLELTDDELAAVMGHEIAHALREHARERMGRQMATQAGTAIGSIALEVLTGVRIDPQLAGTVSQAVFVLPNSREAEHEADRIGVELAARGGYDPRAAIRLWQKMAEVSDGGGPEFLSTHPSPADRLRDLQANAQKVMPLYERASRGERAARQG